MVVLHKRKNQKAKYRISRVLILKYKLFIAEFIFEIY